MWRSFCANLLTSNTRLTCQQKDQHTFIRVWRKRQVSLHSTKKTTTVRRREGITIKVVQVNNNPDIMWCRAGSSALLSSSIRAMWTWLLMRAKKQNVISQVAAAGFSVCRMKKLRTWLLDHLWGGDERLPERTISQCCRHVGQHRVKLLSRERIGGLGWLQSDDAPPAITELQRRSEERESGRCALTAALRAAATPPSGGHTEALHGEKIWLDCWFIYLPCVCVGLFSLLKINKKKSISQTFMSHNLYGLKV